MLVDMTKVHVIGHRKDLDEVVRTLHRLHVVHLVDVADDHEVHLPALSVGDEHLTELQDYQYLRARIESLLALAPELPRVSEPDTEADLDLDQLRRDLNADGAVIERLVEQLDTLVAEQESLPRHIASLSRLLPLLPDMDETPGYETAAALIDRRYPEVLGILDTELAQMLGGNYEIISDRVDSDTIGALVVFPRDSSGNVLSLLGREQLSRVRLPSRYAGLSIRHAAEAMERRLRELPAEIDDRQARINARIAPHADWVVASRRLGDRIDQLTAFPKIGSTAHTFVVCGWIPTPKLSDVRAAVADIGDKTVVVVDSPPDEGETPPVLLDNPPIARPFELFLRLLSLPAYGGFDPTLLMVVFMPLFIGMMLGDIVYGVALLVLSIWVRRRFGGSGGAVHDVSRVLTLAAGWSIVWGVIYGELLGDLGHKWLHLEPIWVNREEALEPLLIFSVGLGCIHVVLGLLLGIWTASRTANRSALVERASLLTALVGTFLLAAVIADQLPSGLITPALAAIIVGLAVMMATGGPIGLLMGPLELLGALGNVLSYLRIAAIGLASVFLAKVANELGAAAPLLLGILIGTLFHTLNLALGAFSPTIQALRLHYVEFFGKFFEQGGDEYQPFGAGPPGSPQIDEAHIGDPPTVPPERR